MTHAFLARRAFLDIGGADAESFLQNLITTDLNGLPEGDAAPGALLTPQGKILIFFLVSRQSTGFRLECESENRDNLLKRLTMYRLRAAVELKPVDADGTALCFDGDGEGLRDIRFAKAGITLLRRAASGADENRQAYDSLRIAHGIAEAPEDFAPGDAFPHDVLMDLNGGLSFRKGCYVGQEVVSRMQHRATARRRIVQVSGVAVLPVTGTPLTAGGKSIGTLGTVIGNAGLAMVRIDKAGAAMAGDQPIFAGDMPVTLRLPGWSGLGFPAEPDGDDT